MNRRHISSTRASSYSTKPSMSEWGRYFIRFLCLYGEFVRGFIWQTNGQCVAGVMRIEEFPNIQGSGMRNAKNVFF